MEALSNRVTDYCRRRAENWGREKGEILKMDNKQGSVRSYSGALWLGYWLTEGVACPISKCRASAF